MNLTPSSSELIFAAWLSMAMMLPGGSAARNSWMSATELFVSAGQFPPASATL